MIWVNLDTPYFKVTLSQLNWRVFELLINQSGIQGDSEGVSYFFQ